MEKKREFKPVAEGEYQGVLKDATITKMKNGNGTRMGLKFEIDVDGESRLVFHDLTVKHKKSKKAEEFGRKGADIFLKAVGVEDGLEGVDNDINAIMDYTDTPLTVCVKIQPSQEYVDAEGNAKISNPRNEVVYFKRV